MTLNSISKGKEEDTFFWPPWALCVHGALTQQTKSIVSANLYVQRAHRIRASRGIEEQNRNKNLSKMMDNVENGWESHRSGGGCKEPVSSRPCKCPQHSEPQGPTCIRNEEPGSGLGQKEAERPLPE